MPLSASWHIRRGDSWRSQRYAVVVEGQAVDLTGNVYTVHGRLREYETGVVRDLHVVPGTATVRVDGTDLLTATVQAGLTAVETAGLASGGRAELELCRRSGDNIDDSDWVVTLVDAEVDLEWDFA